MAETSEFMTDLPQSAYLSLSIRRAISAAQQRSHRYVTLEHLLLSLLDDPDALALLEAVRADIPAIKVSAADTVNRNLATLYTPGQFDLRASYKVERVLQTASDDADRLNCQEVDAAFVLAAISRESDNPAADILKRNAFAYSAAMTWLYSHRGKSTARPAARGAQVPAPPALAPLDEPEPVPEAARMAEAARSEPSRHPSRREDHYSDVDMEVLDDELEDEEEVEEEAAPTPAPTPSRVRETPPARPAAAAARSAHLSPATKPQPVPARGLGEERPGASESRWSDAPPIAPPPAPRRREASGGGGYAPAPAAQAQPQARSQPQPQPQPRRAETPLPSSARLDEMRLRPAASMPRPPLTAPASPPQPQGTANPAAKRRSIAPPATQPVPPAAARAAAPPTAGKAAVPADRQKGRPKARRQSPQEVLVGRLLENIPRRMRAAVPEPIEVRISREESVALSRGMEGRTETIRHDILVTQAMSVMLRSPDGGFSIEPLSPETQWIFERPDSGATESYGRWRWVVTPSETGQRRLQLIVAARSIDKNGLVGDTALPDQIITVKVRMNILRSLWGGIQWIAALALGGVLTELALLGMRLFEK